MVKMTVTASALMLAQRRAQEGNQENSKEPGWCQCSRRSMAVSVGMIELVVSTASVVYTMLDIYYYPKYLPDIFIHDELYVEAKKHTRTNTTIIPKGLLYWDLFLFTIEFLLAITLLYGIAESKLSRIRYWMTSMITYNVILTGIFFGFIIGGISSTRLNFIGFIHAFFRFIEIVIVYGYYEELNSIRKEQRLLWDNNNTISPRIPTPDYGMQREPVPQIMIPIPI